MKNKKETHLGPEKVNSGIGDSESDAKIEVHVLGFGGLPLELSNQLWKSLAKADRWRREQARLLQDSDTQEEE